MSLNPHDFPKSLMSVSRLVLTWDSPRSPTLLVSETGTATLYVVAPGSTKPPFYVQPRVSVLVGPIGAMWVFDAPEAFPQSR